MSRGFRHASVLGSALGRQLPAAPGAAPTRAPKPEQRIPHPRRPSAPETPAAAVAALTVALCAVLLAASFWTGPRGDELYFRVAGQHLDWGYADQPPLVPALARAMQTAFPGSLSALRAPAVLLTSAGVPLTALLARELRGGRKAQLAAAGAYALAPQTIAVGHLLSTTAVDAALWTVTTLLVVRWIRLRDDRLLLLLGVVTSVGIQGKYLVAGLWLALVPAVLWAGPREMFRRSQFWAAGALVAAAAAPGVLWQARHGWPQWSLAEVVPAEVHRWSAGRWAFLPLTVLTAGVVVGAPLVCFGTWALLRSPRFRAYRCLGWACLGVAGLFLAAGGRYYYCAGLFPLCFAAATTEAEHRAGSRIRRWTFRWPVHLLSALFLCLAATPAPGLDRANVLAVGSSHWREFAASVARTYHALPPQERARTAVVADHYWQASALQWYGPQYGLPPAHSPHRGFWYFGAPAQQSRSVLYAGRDIRRIAPGFGTATPLSGPSDNPSSRGTALWWCTDRQAPWPQLWAQWHTS